MRNADWEAAVQRAKEEQDQARREAAARRTPEEWEPRERAPRRGTHARLPDNRRPQQDPRLVAGQGAGSQGATDHVGGGGGDADRRHPGAHPAPRRRPQRQPARPGADAPAPRDKLLTLDDLRTLPPPTPLIKKLIYADTLVQLSAGPGSLKSFLAITMACCLATGQWFGDFAVDPTHQGHLRRRRGCGRAVRPHPGVV